MMSALNKHQAKTGDAINAAGGSAVGAAPPMPWQQAFDSISSSDMTVARLEALIDAGIDLEKRNMSGHVSSHGLTLVHAAVRAGSVPLLEVLYLRGAYAFDPEPASVQWSGPDSVGQSLAGKMVAHYKVLAPMLCKVNGIDEQQVLSLVSKSLAQSSRDSIPSIRSLPLILEREYPVACTRAEGRARVPTTLAAAARSGDLPSVQAMILAHAERVMEADPALGNTTAGIEAARRNDIDMLQFIAQFMTTKELNTATDDRGDNAFTAAIKANSAEAAAYLVDEQAVDMTIYPFQEVVKRVLFDGMADRVSACDVAICPLYWPSGQQEEYVVLAGLRGSNREPARPADYLLSTAAGEQLQVRAMTPDEFTLFRAVADQLWGNQGLYPLVIKMAGDAYSQPVSDASTQVVAILAAIQAAESREVKVWSAVTRTWVACTHSPANTAKPPLFLHVAKDREGAPGTLIFDSIRGQPGEHTTVRTMQ